MRGDQIGDGVGFDLAGSLARNAAAGVEAGDPAVQENVSQLVRQRGDRLGIRLVTGHPDAAVGPGGVPVARGAAAVHRESLTAG